MARKKIWPFCDLCFSLSYQVSYHLSVIFGIYVLVFERSCLLVQPESCWLITEQQNNSSIYITLLTFTITSRFHMWPESFATFNLWYCSELTYLIYIGLFMHLLANLVACPTFLILSQRLLFQIAILFVTLFFIFFSNACKLYTVTKGFWCRL